MELLQQILQAPAAHRLGWTLLHVLWQGACIAALLAMAMVLLRRRSANARYLVACVALALMVAAPIVTYSFVAAPPATVQTAGPTPPAPQPGPAAEVSRAAEPPPPVPPVRGGHEAVASPPVPIAVTDEAPIAAMAEELSDDPVGPAPAVAAAVDAADAPTPMTVRVVRALEPALPWIVAAWVIGAVALSIRNLGGWVAAERLKHVSTASVGENITAPLRRLAERLGVGRAVGVLESLLIEAPTVVGWLRPVILLPAGVVTGLSPVQLEALLLHELAHIRRHDYLINLLQALGETLLFFHPCVWLISRRIRIERENCCDDLAVGAGSERLIYAESLVQVAALSSSSPTRRVATVGMGAVGRSGRSALRGRIVRLLGGPRPVLGRWRWWPVGVVTLLAIMAITVGLSLSQAQDRPAETTDSTGAAEEVAPALGGLLYVRYNIVNGGYRGSTLMLATRRGRGYQAKAVCPFGWGTYSLGRLLTVVRGKLYAISSRQLIEADLTTGERRLVAEKISAYDYHPAGRLYAVVGDKLMVYDFRAGASREIMARPFRDIWELRIAISPDERHLAFPEPVQEGERWSKAVPLAGASPAPSELPEGYSYMLNTRLVVVDLATGKQTRMPTPFGSPYISGGSRSRDPSPPLVWTDANTVLLGRGDWAVKGRPRRALATVDVRTGQMRHVAGIPGDHHTVPSLVVRETGRQVRLVLTRSPWVTDICRVDLAAGRLVEDPVIGPKSRLQTVNGVRRILHEGRPLAGSEEVTHAAVSPDGKRVAWTVSHKGWVNQRPSIHDADRNKTHRLAEGPVAGVVKWVAEADMAPGDPPALAGGWGRLLSKPIPEPKPRPRPADDLPDVNDLMEMTLATDKAAYTQREQVRITLTLRNTSGAELTFKRAGFSLTMRYPNGSTALDAFEKVDDMFGAEQVRLKAGQSLQATRTVDTYDLGTHTLGGQFRGRSERWRGQLKAKTISFVTRETADSERIRKAKFDRYIAACRAKLPTEGGAAGWGRELGPKAAKYLIALLEQEVDGKFRNRVGWGLYGMGSPEALPFLRKCLTVEMRIDSRTAMDTLAKLYDESHDQPPARAESLDLLLGALSHEKPHIRRRAAERLARILHPRVAAAMAVAAGDSHAPTAHIAARYLAAAEELDLTDWLTAVAAKPTHARYVAARAIISGIAADWNVDLGPLPTAGWAEARGDPAVLGQFRKTVIAWAGWAREHPSFAGRFFESDRSRWPARRPGAAAGKAPKPLWIALAPLRKAVKTLTELRVKAFVRNLNQHAAKDGRWEIRTADGRKRITRIAYNWPVRVEQFLPDGKGIIGGTSRSGTFSLNASQCRRIGSLADGDYQLVWMVGGLRRSNVMAFRIDGAGDSAARPPLALEMVPPAPGQPQPMLLIRAYRHAESDPAPLASDVAYATLNVGGEDRRVATMKWTGPDMPLGVGKQYVYMLDPTRYTWHVGSKQSRPTGPLWGQTVFARVDLRPTAPVTLVRSDPLAAGWDAVTATISPEALPKVILSGVVTGSDGRPGVGYVVSLIEAGRPIAHETADAKGRYEFMGIRPRMCTVVAHPKGKGQPELTVRDVDFSREQPCKLDLSLRHAYRIGGRVTDPAGAPVAGYTVMSAWPAPDGKGEYLDFAVTGPDGRYTIGSPFPVAGFVGWGGKQVARKVKAGREDVDFVATPRARKATTRPAGESGASAVPDWYRMHVAGEKARVAGLKARDAADLAREAYMAKFRPGDSSPATAEAFAEVERLYKVAIATAGATEAGAYCCERLAGAYQHHGQRAEAAAMLAKATTVRKAALEADEKRRRRREAMRRSVKDTTGDSNDPDTKWRHLALLAMPGPSLGDCKPAVRYFESKGDWPSLAIACETTAETMWRIVQTPADEFIRPAPAVDPAGMRGNGPEILVQVQTQLDGIWANVRGDAEHWLPWLQRKQKNLRAERTALLGKLGKLCLQRLNDPARAVRAYSAAGRGIPLCVDPIDELVPRIWPKRKADAAELLALAQPGAAHIRMQVLGELADAQLAAGNPRGAAEARLRCMLAMLIDGKGDWNSHGAERQADAFWRAVQQMPAGEPLPPTLWLYVLDPSRPAIALADAEAGPHGYPVSFPGPNVVLRPGTKGRTLTISAEMDTTGGGGYVRCLALGGGKVQHIGSVSWHADKRKGREWRTATIDVPEGAGVIRVRVQPFSGSKFRVHGMKIKAAFTEDTTPTTRPGGGGASAVPDWFGMHATAEKARVGGIKASGAADLARAAYQVKFRPRDSSPATAEAFAEVERLYKVAIATAGVTEKGAYCCERLSGAYKYRGQRTEAAAMLAKAAAVRKAAAEADENRRRGAPDFPALAALRALLQQRWQVKVTPEQIAAAVAPLGARTDEAVDRLMAEFWPRSRNAYRWRMIRLLGIVNTPRAHQTLLGIALSDTRKGWGTLAASAARTYVGVIPDKRRAGALLASQDPRVLQQAVQGLTGTQLSRKTFDRLVALMRSDAAHLRLLIVQVFAGDATEAFADAKVAAIAGGIGKIATMDKADEVWWPGSHTYAEGHYRTYIDALAKIAPGGARLTGAMGEAKGATPLWRCLVLARATAGDKAVRVNVRTVLTDPKAGMFRAWAATALGVIGTQEDLPLLTRVAKTDPMTRKRGGCMSPLNEQLYYPVREAAQRVLKSREKRAADAEFITLRTKAIEAGKAGDVPAAMAAYKELAAKHPAERLRYAYFLSRQGKADEAVTQYLAYYRDHPDQHHVLGLVSEVQAAAGRLRQAVEHRERLLSRTSEVQLGGRRKLLALWATLGGNAQASQRYLAVTEDNTAEANLIVLAHLLLGDIAMEAKDTEGARKQYRLAIERSASLKDAQWRSHVHAALLGQFLSAQRLDDALAVYNSHAVDPLLPRLGSKLRWAGRGQEMLALYQSYLLREPREHIDYAGEGVFYGHLGLARPLIDEIVQVGQGAAIAKRLGEQIARQPKALFLAERLAYLLWRMNRRPEALREFARAGEERGKASATFHAWVGRLCRDAGLVAEATSYYRTALTIELTPEEIRRESSSSSMRSGNDDVATRFKTRILEALGQLHEQSKQWVQAERCYQAIIDLGPDTRTAGRAKTSLARAWKAMGKPNVFIQQRKQRVAAAPKDPAVHRELADALLAAGQTVEAAAQYDRALELAPDDLQVRMALAAALVELKRNDEAVAQYEQVLWAAIERAGASDRRNNVVAPQNAIRRLADLCKRTGKQDRLLAAYTRVLALKGPGSPWTVSEYLRRTILRDMTDILTRRAEHRAVVELWIDHLASMRSVARDAIWRALPRLDSPEPILRRLEGMVTDDPTDYQAKLILGDVLILTGRRDRGLAIYADLAKTVPGEDARGHEALGSGYGRMQCLPEALAAYTAAMEQFSPGTPEYLHRLAIVARLNLRLDRKAEAAKLYRQLIRHAPGNFDFHRRLREATDGGAAEAAPATVPGSATDAAAMRAAADAAARKGEYARAVTLYKRILGKHSTDVRTMVALGRAYTGAGNDAEALAMFEKAHAMGKWMPGAGAASELKRIYRQTKAEDKLVALYLQRNDYSSLDSYYRRQGRPEKFQQHLLGVLAKDPANTTVRLYLGRSYLDSKNAPAAAKEYEHLRDQLRAVDGKAPDKNLVLSVAKGLDRLGRAREALAVLEPIDYANQSDNNDWFGPVLMGLYAKTGQFTKALEVCTLRLRNDPDGRRTVQVAREIAGVSLGGPQRRRVEAYLQELSGNVPARHHKRFAGTVRAYWSANPAEDRTGTPAAAMALLKRGRPARVPPSTGLLAEWLDSLAVQADAVVDQSFQRMASRLPAPRLDRADGPAFELLAEALTGLPVALSMGRDGQWHLHEGSRRPAILGASGGVMCRLNALTRGEGGRGLRTLGHLMFEPAVRRHVVAMQMRMTVLQAVDDQGRKIPAPELKNPLWDPSGQVTVLLGQPEASARNVALLRVRTAVGICTKWVSVTAGRLDHTQPITLEQQGAKVVISPLRTAERLGKKIWQLPVVIHLPPDMKAKNIGLVRDQVTFVTADGKQLPTPARSGPINSAEYGFAVNAFDPSTTSVTIRLPVAIEAVPVTLTFRDVPIASQ